MHTSPDSMLSDLGRIPAEEVKRYVSSRGTEGERPPSWRRPPGRPGRCLESTRDPQLCDMLLDRARFQEERVWRRSPAAASCQGYVRDCIDAANLQTLVRCLRVRKSKEFLAQALIEGGDISTGRASARGGPGRPRPCRHLIRPRASKLRRRPAA